MVVSLPAIEGDCCKLGYLALFTLMPVQEFNPKAWVTFDSVSRGKA